MMHWVKKKIESGLKAFAEFIFCPENSKLVYENADLSPINIKNLGESSIITNEIKGTLGSYLENKDIERLRWLEQNLYHFALLFKFTDPKHISNDYIHLVQIFLLYFPDGKWTYPVDEMDSSTLSDQMNYLLNTVKISSHRLNRDQMKMLGFYAKISDCVETYLHYTHPTLEEIKRLIIEFGGRFNEEVYHQKLDKIARLLKDKLFKFVAEIYKQLALEYLQRTKGVAEEVAKQIEALLEIIDENHLNDPFMLVSTN